MKKIVILCLMIALFVAGCQFKGSGTSPNGDNAIETTGTEKVSDLVEADSETVSGTTVETTTTSETAVFPTCTKNANCSAGKVCIDKQCKTLNDVYTPVLDCQKKCNYNSVKFTTSDGEVYDLKKGEGSYSYAGALEWKVKALPDYCPGQAPKVALLLLKKNAGKVLEETYLTLSVGETSQLITHPTIKRVQFNVKVNSISEACS